MKTLHRTAFSLLSSSILITALVAGMAAFTGCSSSSDSTSGGGTPKVTYEGTLTGASSSGSLTATIGAAAAATQTAVMSLTTSTGSATVVIHFVGGSTVTLNGTFVAPNGPLTIDDLGYTFSGIVANGVLGGTWTGNGDSGTFTALPSSNSQTVTVYCGTYTGSNSGNWNVVVSGSTVTGSFSDSGGTGAGYVWGTLTGGTLTLSFGPDPNTPSGTASAYVSGGAVNSGTWQTTDGSDSGTFTGSTCS